MPAFNITTWLSLTTIGLGLASLYLAWQLHDTRARASSMSEEHAKLRRTVLDSKDVEQQLRAQLASAQAHAPSLRAVAEQWQTWRPRMHLRAAWRSAG